MFSSCVFGNTTTEVKYQENRTGLIGTNIIGIIGEPSDEPYIEIIYSVADEENFGSNKVENIMVSPPYIFQNENVYITYEYLEHGDSTGADRYSCHLIRDFEESGAEYLRIINHSTDKEIEYFIAGAEGKFNGKKTSPSIIYKNAHICYLLYPDSFEGNRIGDITVTEAWSIDDIMNLYRAEYTRSNEIILKVDWSSARIIDLVEGYSKEGWLGNISYGVIEPETELQGNEKIWLLTTAGMFNVYFGGGEL